MGSFDFCGDDLIFSGNDKEEFDDNVKGKLGCYVYALCDPRDRKVFYIGKAGGSEGKGNDRIFDHFDGAREALREKKFDVDQKTRRIIDIWRADEKVDWYIIRHGMSVEVAFQVEAALIDLLAISQNGPALNSVRGHGAAKHGILSPEMVRAFSADPVCPSGNFPAVFIFPIQNAIDRGESVYEATRKAWSVPESLLNVKDAVAVGVVNGISKGVFTILQWKKWPSPQNQSSGSGEADSKGDSNSKSGLSRSLFQFDGHEVYASELSNRDFGGVISKAMGYWRRGNYLVIEIKKNDDGKICFRFLRGNQNKVDFFDF